MTSNGAILTSAICLGQFMESEKSTLFIKEMVRIKADIVTAAVLEECR